MIEMQWEDPPPRSPKVTAAERNRKVLAELMEHPGKWARVPTGAQAWLRWGCEVTIRGSAVWARWPDTTAAGSIVADGGPA